MGSMAGLSRDRQDVATTPGYRVAAVVLSWNGRDETLRCLASLADVVHFPLSVIVVDNGSVDGSPDAVADSFPEVVLVRLSRNSGFSGGVNTGIATALESGADAVLLLNNDMVVQPGFLAPLIRAIADDPLAAAACSQILFADPPHHVWYAGASYNPRRGHQGRNIGFGGERLPPDTPPYAVDCACGGAMLIPREALEAVGIFDEELFAYREDLDWSLRAREQGRRVLVAPASVVEHRVSASSGGESSPTSLYYDTRNGLVVADRQAPLPRLPGLLRSAEWVLAHAIQALLSRRRLEGLRAVRDGWQDARKGRLGRRP